MSTMYTVARRAMCVNRVRRTLRRSTDPAAHAKAVMPGGVSLSPAKSFRRTAQRRRPGVPEPTATHSVDGLAAGSRSAGE